MNQIFDAIKTKLDLILWKFWVWIYLPRPEKFWSMSV